MKADIIRLCLAGLGMVAGIGGILWVVRDLLRNRSRVKTLELEILTAWAERDSYKGMYGPNRMDRLPDTQGTVSETVLIDVGGQAFEGHFCLGYYSYAGDVGTWVLLNTEHIDPAMTAKPAMLMRGRWYRLPTQVNERKRTGKK